MDEDGGPRRPFRILAMDGGGVRGLISSLWLAELEDEMLACGKGRLYERFDLLAGTSTGAIAANAIALGIKAKAVCEFFRGYFPRVYPGPVVRLVSRMGRPAKHGEPRYSSKPVETLLKKLFHVYKLGDARVPLIVVSYDISTRKPLIYKSWEHRSVPMWRVCMASSAAPGYFPAAECHDSGPAVVDGALVANNPSMCALAEALHLGTNSGKSLRIPEDVLLVSFGCGAVNGNGQSADQKSWFDLLLDGSDGPTEHACAQIMGESFHRFQYALPEGLDPVDDASADTIEALESVAREVIVTKEFRSKIARIVEVL